MHIQRRRLPHKDLAFELSANGSLGCWELPAFLAPQAPQVQWSSLHPEGLTVLLVGVSRVSANKAAWQHWVVAKAVHEERCDRECDRPHLGLADPDDDAFVTRWED